MTDFCLSVVFQRLESEKETLERDLSFKADQARQYDCLLEAVRENNRQLQVQCTCLTCVFIYVCGGICLFLKRRQREFGV